MNYKGKDFKEMGVIGIFKVEGLEVFLFLAFASFILHINVPRMT